MSTLWFILVALMLTTYVVLDGFDLGAGVLHLGTAKNDAERRTVLRAIGPVWDGNEVWLIAAGGTLFFSFPILYARAFSGFYLPLFLVLWLLMLRGIAIELRSTLPSLVWSSFWDGCFTLGSTLLAFVFGVALANVVRGVAINSSGTFFEPLWTTFSPLSKAPGVIDWYTALIGLLAVAALTVHGAAYLVMKTAGALQQRLLSSLKCWWAVLVVLLTVSTAATFLLRPPLLHSFVLRPWITALPLAALIGLFGTMWSAQRAKESAAFLFSCLFIGAMLASTAAVLYPDVLPAVNPARSLTVTNTAASTYGLSIGLVWWTAGIVLAITYFTFTYRLFHGKVHASVVHRGS
ncbi:MAG: cytochrome d ubiquinol oxidase subunit II [Chloroflexi bacterium]|nr:cytochrome d ubiquinol oxidase subunit II [Chloroflexota bacterium]